MKVKHTPGPWKYWQVAIPFKGWEVIGANNQGIAKLPDTGSEDSANARLIASAPELPEACRAAQGWLMLMAKDHPDAHDKLNLVDAAIAKAEGRL